MHYYYGNFGDHMFFGGLLHIALWIALIALVVWAVRGGLSCHGRKCTHGQDNIALTILKERYARGEIGKEEFDAKKKDLSE